jgi:hypothetical protein
MTIPDNTATLFEQDRATNDKVLATDAAALRVYQGHDLSLQQTGINYARMMAEANALFAQALTQRDQLFSQALRHSEDNHQVVVRMAQQHATLDVKILDKDSNEVNSEATPALRAGASVGAKVVDGIEPVITAAVEAAVARSVNNASVSDDAIAAAVSQAVVAALKQS